MQFSNVFVVIYLIGQAFSFILNQLLEYIDFSWRKKHGKEIPHELYEYIDGEILNKTCAYEDARYFLWVPKNILSTALSLTLVLTGFYVWLYESLWAWTNNSYLTVILFVILASIPGSILSLPFDLIREFHIEKKFGFSNMTIKMWLADEAKQLLITLIISIPLLCAAIALFTHAPKIWWIILGCIYVAFTFLASYVYPIWIAPMFNKFTPLEDGELKTRLEALLVKTGFKAKSMFVMDASKRSAHSNAYFTGLGKNKRIVLYDTLINQLSVDEIEAVLAHELGHYKKKHILRKQCILIPLIFVMLFAINVFVKITSLYEGFGVTITEDMLCSTGFFGIKAPYILYLGMFLTGLIFEGYSPLVELVSNLSSRHDEFQADAFSAKLCGSGKPLTTALIKLNKENLSEVTEPKIYSIFNDNHPPLLDRIHAL